MTEAEWNHLYQHGMAFNWHARVEQFPKWGGFGEIIYEIIHDELMARDSMEHSFPGRVWVQC